MQIAQKKGSERRRGAIFILVVLPLLSGCGSCPVANSPKTGQHIVNLTAQRGETIKIDIGEVEQAQIISNTVLFKNLTKGPIVIANISVSCPCVAFGNLPVSVQAGQMSESTVTFDMSSEPNFAGDLATEIVGFDTFGTKRFGILAYLRVRRDAERAIGQLVIPPQPVPMLDLESAGNPSKRSGEQVQ